MNNERRNPLCNLDRLPGDKMQGKQICRESECRFCGWNVDVDKARKWYIRRFGLTKGKTGFPV